MFGSAILDIALGLGLVYLLLSLICQNVNEWIARALAMRSHMLEEWLRSLLKSSTNPDKLVEDFYNHPLIARLSPPNKGYALAGRGGRPSYIPSRDFTLALLDTLAPEDETGPKTIVGIRTTVSKIENEDVKKQLLLILDASEQDIEKAQLQIEQWFNDAMERVSGWYRRNMQLCSLVVALVITLLLNADTLLIADAIAHNATVRAAIVSTAREDHLETAINAADKLEQLGLPLGWSLQNKRADNYSKEIIFGPVTWNVVTRVIGLLLTAFAVSLGAPFWFEVLSKLSGLRATGRAPAKLPT